MLGWIWAIYRKASCLTRVGRPPKNCVYLWVSFYFPSGHIFGGVLTFTLEISLVGSYNSWHSLVGLALYSWYIYIWVRSCFHFGHIFGGSYFHSGHIWVSYSSQIYEIKLERCQNFNCDSTIIAPHFNETSALRTNDVNYVEVIKRFVHEYTKNTPLYCWPLSSCYCPEIIVIGQLREAMVDSIYRFRLLHKVYPRNSAPAQGLYLYSKEVKQQT